MAKKKTSTGKPARPEGKQDFFVRVDDPLAERFDKLVAAMVPRSSRSAVIAMLIQQFVDSRESGGK